MSDPYRFTQGDTPLLVSMPHVGLRLPDDLAARLSAPARALPDTDWHVDRLYDFAAGLGASLIQADYSRYVVDLNRPPDDRPLYPGASGTGLCPETLFDGTPLYLKGQEPDLDEIAGRLVRFWRPYHVRLAEALAELKARHGFALLFDAHSIRSEVPRLFEGRLPDLNFGSADGASAAPDLASAMYDVCRSAEGFTAVRDGRFTGGYITRHYGRPADGIHALQLELAQITYMDEEPPFAFDESRAGALRPTLRRLLETFRDWSLGR